MRRYLFLYLLFGSVLIGCGVGLMVTGDLTLRGTVWDMERGWINQATVILERDNGQTFSTVTNARGEWNKTVSGMMCAYRLSAMKDGYIFDHVEIPAHVTWSANNLGWFRFPVTGVFDPFRIYMRTVAEPTKALSPTPTRTKTPTFTPTCTVVYPTITFTPVITPTELYPPVVGTNTPSPTPFVAFFADPWAETAVYADYYMTMPIKIDNPRVAPMAAIAKQERLGPPTTLLYEFALHLPDGEVTIYWMEFGCKYILWYRSDMPNAIHIMDAYGYSMYEQNQLGEGE